HVGLRAFPTRRSSDLEVLVSVGDTVAREQSLITVESDKASMEIPSSDAGVVTAVKVKVGDKVSEGSDIAVLKAEGKSEAKAAARSEEHTSELQSRDTL